MINAPIYRTKGMIILGAQNYIGTIDLFEDKCIVYDNRRTLDIFEFDIIHTDIETGNSEISFLDLYTKTKSFIRLVSRDKKSIKYFLEEHRKNLFIGKFEKRKAECRSYSIVIKAADLGYTGETTPPLNKSNIEKSGPNDTVKDRVLTRFPSELKTWEDLLTPLEWRDYYHSLGATGKKIYDIIISGIIDCKKTVLIDGINLKSDVIGVIYHYILWDNPAIFCIGEYAMWRALEEDKKHVKITSLCGNAENERVLRQQVLSAVLRILRQPDLYKYSDIQKEKYVHDYIIKNWSYDRTCGNGGARLEPYTVYGALVQKTAVCEGFAKAAKLLLDILGVHTQVVSGTIKSAKEGHSWNSIKISGQAYHLDITYDLGQTGGNKLPIRYDYFNVADKDLIDRSWTDPHVVWRCSSVEHSYPACVGGLVETEEALKTYIIKELKKQRPYMYIKLTGKSIDIKNKIDWIKRQYYIACGILKLSSKAMIIPTDILNLYVIAVNN